MSGTTVWQHQEWVAEAERRFGKDPMDWRFVCPRCGTVQGGHELRAAGLSDDQVGRALAFSCIGRFRGDAGCDWTLGGLLKIHEHEVELPDGKRRPVFAFAEPERR